jgi:RHS repeat-associated protein
VTKRREAANPTLGQEIDQQYFYHTDHLGSAQMITNTRGTVTEHIEYTPYGELWIEQRLDAGAAKTPFRFTGKEMDSETGLYYYGARYLNPQTSLWLSADPAMGEYIPGAPVNDEVKKRNENLPGMGGVFNTVNLHTFHYAGNNPVKYTDPDGRKFVIEGDQTYERQVKKDLRATERALRKSGDKDALKEFKGLKRARNFVVVIRKPDGKKVKGNEYHWDAMPEDVEKYKADGILYYDPANKRGGLNVSGGYERDSFVGLGHEAKHGIDDRNNTHAKNIADLRSGIITPEEYHYRTEDSAIDFENAIRKGYYGKGFEVYERLPAMQSHTFHY